MREGGGMRGVVGRRKGEGGGREGGRERGRGVNSSQVNLWPALSEAVEEGV